MHTVDHNHLPSEHTVRTATDENLADLHATFEDHVWDCDLPSCHRIFRWLDSEVEGREIVNNDDDRVREAYGLYR